MNYLIISFFFFFNLVSAHVPSPAQIGRNQARMLALKKVPFTVKGKASVRKSSIETKLEWYGPMSYDLTLLNVPTSLYAFTGDKKTEPWVLSRRPGSCSFRTQLKTTSCPSPMFWAAIELSANPSFALKTLQLAGFFSSADTVFSETHSQNPTPPSSDKRVHLEIGKNGSSPKAVLRIHTPTASSMASNKDKAPHIDFDQTFYAPLKAFFLYDGEWVEIRSSSNLSAGRNLPRYSHIIATQINVSGDQHSKAIFNREERQYTPKLQAPDIEKTITEISSFRQTLNVDGQNLLDAILLTH